MDEIKVLTRLNPGYFWTGPLWGIRRSFGPRGVVPVVVVVEQRERPKNEIKIIWIFSLVLPAIVDWVIVCTVEWIEKKWVKFSQNLRPNFDETFLNPIPPCIVVFTFRAKESTDSSTSHFLGEIIASRRVVVIAKTVSGHVRTVVVAVVGRYVACSVLGRAFGNYHNYTGINFTHKNAPVVRSFDAGGSDWLVGGTGVRDGSERESPVKRQPTEPVWWWPGGCYHGWVKP